MTRIVRGRYTNCQTPLQFPNTDKSGRDVQANWTDLSLMNYTTVSPWPLSVGRAYGFQSLVIEILILPVVAVCGDAKSKLFAELRNVSFRSLPLQTAGASTFILIEQIDFGRQGKGDMGQLPFFAVVTR
jgi:hypothetical protein